MRFVEIVRRMLRADDEQVIRELVRPVAWDIMEAAVSELIGTAQTERGEDRDASQRRSSRRSEARAGEIDSQIPQIR